MATIETIERMESQLVKLVDGMLARKADQMDFLIGLNRLDDILLAHQRGIQATSWVTRFLEEYGRWRSSDVLDKGQRKRLGGFLAEIHQCLLDNDDADSLKTAEEIKDWLRECGDGAFRLTLKKPKEQASLADRFRILAEREAQEIGVLTTERGHLLTCLDDVLKSAEAKTDPMYRHLAASMIYFLQMEGYKVDPYVKQLRRINKET
jgi:hypothetical protein